MSAIIGRFGYPSRDGKDPGLWIKNQPAFYLHENLTLENLKAQLAEAHSEDSSAIYVKNPGKGNGHTRLDVWYVEALIPQLERNDMTTQTDYSICRDPMLAMVDAIGAPRIRYVRVSHNGAHEIMTPAQVECFIQESQISGDETPYILTETHLSEREFDDLPEFEGF